MVSAHGGSYTSHPLHEVPGLSLRISQIRIQADQLPAQSKIPFKTC